MKLEFSYPFIMCRVSPTFGTNVAILTVGNTDEPTDEELDMGRRIVACVNACQGLSTEALESGALGIALNALNDTGSSFDRALLTKLYGE